MASVIKECYIRLFVYTSSPVMSLESDDMWIYLAVDLLLMPWQRKQSVKTTSSLNGPAFRPKFKTPSLTLFLFLRGQDAETEQLFPHFHKLLSLSAGVLSFSCYPATDMRHTRLLPLSSSHCSPATSCQEVKSLFLHQNSILVTFSFTTWLYERDVHPVSSLGKEDKKRSSEQDITFPPTGKSVADAVQLWPPLQINGGAAKDKRCQIICLYQTCKAASSRYQPTKNSNINNMTYLWPLETLWCLLVQEYEQKVRLAAAQKDC